jgi:hypothetical protein
MEITVCWDVIPISAKNLDIQRNLLPRFLRYNNMTKRKKTVQYIYIYDMTTRCSGCWVSKGRVGSMAWHSTDRNQRKVEDIRAHAKF